MKKYLLSLIIMLSIAISGCGLKKQTAREATENFLIQYKSLSSKVIADMDDVVQSEDLNDLQKETYRDILKKQYQDLTYEIVNEEYNGDKAFVDVKIIVYDLYKAQKDANSYLINNDSEFRDSNKEFNNDLFMEYKLNLMKKTNETKDYIITFNLIKDKNGDYVIEDVSNEVLEKIHGIYNYDSD